MINARLSPTWRFNYFTASTTDPAPRAPAFFRARHAHTHTAVCNGSISIVLIWYCLLLLGGWDEEGSSISRLLGTDNRPLPPPSSALPHVLRTRPHRGLNRHGIRGAISWTKRRRAKLRLRQPRAAFSRLRPLGSRGQAARALAGRCCSAG